MGKHTTRQKFQTNKGFSAIEVLAIIAVICLLVSGGLYVFQQFQYATRPAAAHSSAGSASHATDDYGGWKTACDASSKACYRYPGDWIAGQYGGVQNRAGTAFAEYQGSNTKDQAVGQAYIASITGLSVGGAKLDIVGFVDGNSPLYAVYNAVYITQAQLHVGETAQLITKNPTFAVIGQGGAVSFVATPGAQGLASVASAVQAKAWFNTAEAQTCLKVLQSLYSQ